MITLAEAIELVKINDIPELDEMLREQVELIAEREPTLTEAIELIHAERETAPAEAEAVVESPLRNPVCQILQ